MFRRILPLILVLSAQVVYAGYSVRLEETTDKNKITIGDRINCDIKVVMPDSFSLKEPEKTAELGEWSVKEISAYEDKKDLSKHIKYTLTAYTTGEVLIPVITVKFFDDKQKEESIKTQPVEITIESVLSKVKGPLGLRDIAPVMALQVP